MGLFTLEQSKLAYRADFALYGGAVAGMVVLLMLAGPRAHPPASVLWVGAGLLGCSAIEYALHRFVLHGLEPFRGWHAAHHQRPGALICAPTILSATLIALLVFVPAWLLGDLWLSCALTLGLLAGYLAYAVTHHATHHWRADSAWLQRRKRWHALHHHVEQPACYGVTSALWDHVFGSLPRARAVRASPRESPQDQL